MLKKTCFYVSSVVFLFSSLRGEESLNRHIGEHIGWTSMYSLPQSEIDAHFDTVQEAANYRWNLLAYHREFPLYSPEREESSLTDEFYQFSNMRINLWLEDPNSLPCRSNPLFKISQAHLVNARFRQPCCITFDHAATDASYNSTSITLGKRRFFALEGPTEEHVPYFFRLLANWNVAYVVCLTEEADATGAPKCSPYWKDHLINKEEGQFLEVRIDGAYEQSPASWGSKNFPYLFWPDWQDHHGVDPQELVERADQVRKSVKEGGIIAVHCSAGVGRTGTFIAAISLLDAIDEQLAAGISPQHVQLSIAQLFIYMNFHRPWLIAKPSQYITLYKMVEWYLQQQEKKPIELSSID